MRKYILSILLLAGVLFIPFYASADPPYGMSGGGGMQQGMGMRGGGPGGGGPMMGGMGGCGMEGCGMSDGHGMFGFDHFAMLNLTPVQQSDLNRIKLNLEKQEWALKGKTFDMRASLRDLYSADRPDPKKIGAVYGQLFDIKRQMIEAQIDAMNRAHDILNKDQLARLKQLEQQHEYGACQMHERMHEQMGGR